MEGEKEMEEKKEGKKNHVSARGSMPKMESPNCPCTFLSKTKQRQVFTFYTADTMHAGADQIKATTGKVRSR